MTEQEIIKKFEELGWKVNKNHKLTLFNTDRIIDICIYHDKSYTVDGILTLQEKQLLTELFKCWRWL